MEKDILPSLAKRMLFSTKVILTFFVIGMLLFINFLDLKEKNKDSRYLNLIKRVHERASDLEFENFELERKDYLEKTNPVSGKLHVDARNLLVASMNMYSAGVNWEAKGSGNSKNRFILMANKKMFEMPERVAVYDGYEIADNKIKAPQTVDSAIQTFSNYANAEMVYMIKRVDTAVLFRKLDSALKTFEEKDVDRVVPHIDNNLPGVEKPRIFGNSQTRLVKPKNYESSIVMDGPNIPDVRGDGDGTHIDPGMGTNTEGVVTGNITTVNRKALFQNYKEFEEVYLSKDTLFVNYRDKRGINQMLLNSYSISLPVEVDSMLFPSTLHFAGFSDDLVNELISNPGKKKQLQNSYGYYELSMIDGLTAEAISNNNDAVSILGFDISRKWFPLAMFLVLSIIYAFLYDTMKNARSHNYKIISEYNSDEALEFLVDKKGIRFFLWIVAPLLLASGLVYSSLIQHSSFFYLLIFGCAVICTIFGILCYKMSMSL